MENIELTVSNFMEYPIGLKIVKGPQVHLLRVCQYVHFRQVYNLTYS